MASGQGDAQRLAHNRPHRQALVRQVGEHDRSIDLPGEHLSSKIIRDDFAQVQHYFRIGGAAIAIVLIELGLQTERTPRKLGLAVVRSLARNPLIVSPVAGVLVAATHVTVPLNAETLLKLLSGATSPCALVSLGLFLAEKRPALGGSLLLTGSKLLLQPILTWWLAARVFTLPLTLVQMAVVLAALPTGPGPVHARGVLSTRSAHHVADDSLVDGGFARVFVLTAILYAPKQVKDLTR
jgi:Membrane transport protein